MDLQRLNNVLLAKATTALGGSTSDDYSSWAEDLVQDTVLTLIEKGITDEDAAFKLGTKMILNQVADHRRTERRRREIERQHKTKINTTLTGQSAELLAADPLEIMAYEEMRDRLDQLSPLIYGTVEDYYIKGLSVEHIAFNAEVTEAVIYKRLQRARDFITNGEEDGSEDR